MTSATQSPEKSNQTATWLRGLLTIAWADGHFDPEEQALIEDVVTNDSGSSFDTLTFQPISAEALAKGLGNNPHTAENFLRTGVMVALADGVYSSAEDALLESFCQALRIQTTVVDSLRLTLDGEHESMPPDSEATDKPHRDPLKPVRQWLDGLDIQDPEVARFLCKMIPPQCPFERDITLFGRKVVHIPPMCKLNPLYEQLVGLRFKSLSYLADE
ncbi:MAG: DUF533 domain-containing protein, partial [Acaryochloridaceae cyanobacterium CSU_5_19]|nr:DUF533 domain-containing protein [Acaryochloridaceae cyanobacterium CSU_5_19]